MKVNEIFLAIQGEGPWIGKPAIFIRTTGCVPPYCKFCDSKYSWKNGTEYPIKKIIEKLKKFDCHNIVITGGEPLIQNDFYTLIKELNFNHPEYKIQIETSGKSKLLMHLIGNVTIVCSPKQYNGKFVIQESVINDAHYFKFVVGGTNDFNNVLAFVKKYDIPNHKVYLMPLTTYNKGRDAIIKRLVWQLCIKHNFNYSARIHIDLWGKTRKK